MTSEFSEVLASMRPQPDGTLKVVVPEDWLQGRSVFGGLQMALAGRAMRSVLPADRRDLPLRKQCPSIRAQLKEEQSKKAAAPKKAAAKAKDNDLEV